jgi:peptidyl-prolyl cis-trans isomerase B (cyclophilin B)
MATSKQRREAERRRLQRQMQRRVQREARRRRILALVSVLGVLVVVAVVIMVVVLSSDDKSPKAGGKRTSPAVPTTSAVHDSTSAAPSYPCSWSKSGPAARKVSVPATTTPPRTGKVTVSVTTNRGPLSFALDRAEAPCTVASFVSLVKQHYYDGTPCHRLTTSGIYVLQCGDPLGTGAGDPGYTVPDEATGHESYPAGTIAMARAPQQANSGGSQFFIVYKDSPNLVQGLGTQQYTVFGKVAKGWSVVDKVAAAGAVTASDGKPKLPITLQKVTVSE